MPGGLSMTRVGYSLDAWVWVFNLLEDPHGPPIYHDCCIFPVSCCHILNNAPIFNHLVYIMIRLIINELCSLRHFSLVIVIS